MKTVFFVLILSISCAADKYILGRMSSAFVLVIRGCRNQSDFQTGFYQTSILLLQQLHLLQNLKAIIRQIKARDKMNLHDSWVVLSIAAACLILLEYFYRNFFSESKQAVNRDNRVKYFFFKRTPIFKIMATHKISNNSAAYRSW